MFDFHSFAFVCVRTCMLCALCLKIALQFLFNFLILLKISCPAMTRYHSHSVAYCFGCLLLYIFVSYIRSRSWGTKKKDCIWMWIVQCRTVNRHVHKYSSPMRLEQYLIPNAAFFSSLCELLWCVTGTSVFHALIVVHFTVKC